MKKRIFWLSILFFSLTSATLISNGFYTNKQQDPVILKDLKEYSREWQHVEELIANGKPKSALLIVDSIYSLAKEEGNGPQIIKCVLNKVSLEGQFQEEVFENAVEHIDKEIEVSKVPERNLFQSIKAQLLWSYYEYNQYRFQSRTRTPQKPEKISEWDLQTLTAEVEMLYLSSLDSAEILQQYPTRYFDAIMHIGKDQVRYRPTLYDFLAHRSMDFFLNPSIQISRAASRFIIKDENTLGNIRTFLKIDLEKEASPSNQLRVLQMMQQLMQFHSDAANQDALWLLDLKRLQFVHQHAQFKEKDRLYKESLERIMKKNEAHPIYAEAAHQLAQWYYSSGAQYHEILHPDKKNDWRAGADLCASAMEKHEGSFGALHCEQLLRQIHQQQIEISLPFAFPSNEKQFMKINWKNTDFINYRIIPIEFKEYMEMDYANNRHKLIQKLKRMKARAQETVSLLDEKDFQEHSTEVVLSPLPTGHYVLIAETEAKYEGQVAPKLIQTFWVTDISAVNRSTKTDWKQLYVADRNTGQALEGAVVKEIDFVYHRKKKKYERIVRSESITGHDGIANIPVHRNAWFDYFEITYGKDLFLLSANSYTYNHYPEKTQTRTFFYTDRAIYRPGQTVYFKGIISKGKNHEYKVLKYHEDEITFYDVNGQKIISSNLRTNEYGSFNGSFTIPSGILNGNMRLASKYGSANIRVEEYKRPKFYAEIDKPDQEYRLNEDVLLKGRASAYSGAGISDAKVEYRVVRKIQFPYWRYGFWFPRPHTPDQEIANGTVYTNEEGRFSIPFHALPDFTTTDHLDPVYHYTVSADITDINGETHSASQTVVLGKKAMQVELMLDEMVWETLDEKIRIRFKNLDGQGVKGKGSITIYPLISPKRAMRSRAWEAPDRPAMTEEEFLKHFPLDVYKAENHPQNWEKGAAVHASSFEVTAGKAAEIQIDEDLIHSFYSVEVEAPDRYGEKVHASQIVRLMKSGRESGDPTELFRVMHQNPGKTSWEPGESVQYLLETANPVNRIYYSVQKNNKILEEGWMESNERQQTAFKYAIKEEHRGNIHMEFMAVGANRLHYFEEDVVIPFSNKQLNIRFETFRNKLLPGSKEKWKLVISGPEQDKIAAEMVATLYDASLESFVKHQFTNPVDQLFRAHYRHISWEANNAFQNAAEVGSSYYKKNLDLPQRLYSSLNWFDFPFYGYHLYGLAVEETSVSSRRNRGFRTIKNAMSRREKSVSFEDNAELEMAVGEYTDMDGDGVPNQKFSADSLKMDVAGQNETFAAIKARTDFRETAFFYPDLKTNKEGHVIIEFSIPESLTRWKMLGMAHTPDLKSAVISNELETQKELMVVPNAPRFFREGDRLQFSSKLSNLTDKKLNARIRIQLFDALNMKEVTSELLKSQQDLTVDIAAGGNEAADWSIQIPSSYSALTYRVSAYAGNHSDAEESSLPVLKNSMLVTETFPLSIRGNELKKFEFTRLSQQSSSSLKSHLLKLEFTSNPAWNAILALPYLMEYPHECAEQVFSRYYANSFASHIVNSDQEIKRVFDIWRSYQPNAFLSNLEKNQEIKSAMLEETPWVRAASDEKERKQRVAILFDLERMSREQDLAWRKIKKMQLSNGAWPWFIGMTESRHITQYIVSGIGHLVKNGVLVQYDRTVVEKAIHYLDEKMRKDYNDLLKRKFFKKDEYQTGMMMVNYLYTRTFFRENFKLQAVSLPAYNFFYKQAGKYWLEYPIQVQAMLAMTAHYKGDTELATNIMNSLREKALRDDEMGLYWKKAPSFYWYMAPIETQAVMIEAVDLILDDQQMIEEMKIWLLKQKQTRDWKTTKATVQACNALLLYGENLLEGNEIARIKVGGRSIDPAKEAKDAPEAGTGYFTVEWRGSEITPDKGKIEIKNTNPGIAWGGLYWQYFEQLDKITAYDTPLKIKKEVFVKNNTKEGQVLRPVSEKDPINTGDRVVFRIVLESDRDMEYVHLKDMRASCFEPVQTLSGFHYRDGLGYYQSMKDASANFFFSFLPKGSYVFEYEVFATMAGNYSNGISSVQCMYAPEFAAHSEGIRVKVAY